MDEKKNILGKKLLAWSILLVIVWFFGTLFINAASQSGERPSDDLKPGTETKENKQVSPVASKAIGKLQILQPGLNLRSEPKKSDTNVVKTLNKDDVLPILSATAGWYEVLSGKQKGYVTNNPQYIKVLELKK